MTDFDDFDDVDISTVSHTSRAYTQRTHFYNKTSTPTKIPRPIDAIYRSSTSSLPHKSQTSSTPPRANSSPMNNNNSPTRPSYSPSKRLKQLRQHKNDPLDLSTLDNSDDELDESTIIFDVPLSQSLVQLTQHQKLVKPKLMSIASDSTRQSSLMSYDHRGANDSTSDFELDDAFKLTCEYAQSRAVQTAQESAMRCHILSQLEKPQGIDHTGSDVKQKYLTNTRPTHLPPKDKEESLRHSREVEELKQRAIREEMRLEKKKLKQIQKRQKMKAEDLAIWQKEILPDFNNKVMASSTRELWWRGVPPQLRRQVWMSLLDHQTIKPAVVQALRARAMTLIKKDTPEIQAIKKDTTTVFPDLSVFQDSPLADDLLMVLVMYCEHSEYPYDSSLCSLTAVLMYNIRDVTQVFIALCSLLQRHLLKLLYTKDDSALDKESQSFLRTLKKKNTRLYTHLHTTLKIQPSTYLSPLLKPVFSNLLSMDVASSIMDVYLFEGDAFLWRCVLGLFEKIGYRLFGNEQEILDVIGWDALSKLNGGKVGVWWKYLDVGDDVDFLETVRLVLKKKL